LNNLEKISNDPTAAERKQDHIQLAFQSQVESLYIDKRFAYEPMLAAHPSEQLPTISFLDKKIQTPIWVSSMTGGTEKAYQINSNLAKACNVFGMGMGLGSCRSLLESNERLLDFDFRKIIGDALPFYANIGIAQLEILIKENKLFLIDELIDKLSADGIIIHVNPLQEWLQPEGDKITQMPIKTLQYFLDKTKQKVIVKEVGQGFGKESLRALVQLPIHAIEFAAHGGTNFSKLELLRSNATQQAVFNAISQIGHSAEEMVAFINELKQELNHNFACQQFIISGGVKSFLDGYYLMEKLQANAIYGQASGLLKYAEIGYEELHQYIETQIEGLKLAKAFFKVK
jgi:isopentenyl-diphosphate delta-isomerase